jgi:hypothetical protein
MHATNLLHWDNVKRRRRSALLFLLFLLFLRNLILTRLSQINLLLGEIDQVAYFQRAACHAEYIPVLWYLPD